MKYRELLPINLVGVGTAEYDEKEKAKWMLVVVVYYIIISVVNRRFKGHLYSGLIIRYQSFNRWRQQYIKNVFIGIMLASLVNYVLSYNTISVVEGLISVILLSLNFTVKAIVILLITNEKNYNLVFCICIILEVISVNITGLRHINLWGWSMLSRSNYIVSDGYNILFVILCQIIIIASAYVLKCTRKNYVD